MEDLKEELKTLQDYKKVTTDFLRSAEVECAGYDKRIAELEKQIADSEKPELRHGDIRLWNPSREVGIIDMSEPNHHVIWKDGDKRNCASIDNSTLIGTLREVLGDLAALQEPLRSFCLDVHDYEINDSSFGNSKIHMAGNNHTIEEVKEHIANLRRLVHTAESK